MATAIAKLRREVVSYDTEFTVDSTETIIHVEDLKDGTAAIYVMSYIRKG